MPTAIPDILVLALLTAGAPPVTVLMLRGAVLPQHLVKLVILGLGVRTLAIGFWFYRIATSQAAADARSYLAHGRSLLSRNSPLTLDLSGNGTDFMETLAHTGLRLLADSNIVMFGVAALSAHIALLLLIRSVRLMLDLRSSTLFAALSLSVPSLIFWSSTFGKEAISLAGMALAAYGLSRWRTTPSKRWTAALSLAVGPAILWAVRSELLFLLLVSLILTFLIAPSPTHERKEQIHARALRRLAAACVLGLALSFSGLFLPTDTDPGLAPIAQDLENRIERTRLGGSSIGSGEDNLVLRVVGVWTRPFPWNIRDLNQLLAFLEALTLLCLFGWLLLRPAHVRDVLQWPPAQFAAYWLLGSWIVLATVSNIGLMVRLRSLAIPALAFLLASTYRRKIRAPSLPAPEQRL